MIHGIVLRAVDTKESDKILTVLTDRMGKIPVVAKGARSRRSRISAAAQLLAYSEMTLTENHNWQILSEASTMELFSGVRQDIELLSLGSYFVELADAVTYEGLPAQEILSLLLNALYALDTLKRPQLLVKAAYEVKLMALTGFEPLLDGCAYCGKEEPEKPMLDVVHGTLRCRRCGGKGNGLAMPLSSGSLAALRHVIYGDPKRLYAFTLPQEDLKVMAHAAEAYVAAQVERGFLTLDYYKRIKLDYDS